jgi:hypothetical protein
MKKKNKFGNILLMTVPFIVIAIWGIIIFGIIYLFFNPESIGEYIGRIMNGFK